MCVHLSVRMEPVEVVTTAVIVQSIIVGLISALRRCLRRRVVIAEALDEDVDLQEIPPCVQR